MSLILISTAVAWGSNAAAGEIMCKGEEGNRIPKGTEIVLKKQFQFSRGKNLIWFRPDTRTTCNVMLRKKPKGTYTAMRDRAVKIEDAMTYPAGQEKHALLIELNDRYLSSIYCEDTGGYYSYKSPFTAERIVKSLERHFDLALTLVECPSAPTASQSENANDAQ